MLTRHHEIQGTRGPQRQAVWQVVALRGAVKDYVLGLGFMMMDKRKKVLQEFKGLPKCAVTGLPQHLGKDQWWNQVVVRVHVPRTSHCHHCHRLFDHRLSVREACSGIWCG